MLEPDSLIYLSERTIRINANSILDHTNGRTKKVAKQFFTRTELRKYLYLSLRSKVFKQQMKRIAAKSLKLPAV